MDNDGQDPRHLYNKFQGEYQMNIIEEMYNGDLFPVDTYEHSSEEYKKIMNELTSAEAELLAAYPQIRELFDKYQSAQIDLISINNRQEFVNGFRVGAQMMLEMLKKIE